MIENPTEEELVEGFIMLRKCHEHARRSTVGVAAKTFQARYVIGTTISGVVLLLLHFVRHAVLKHNNYLSVEDVVVYVLIIIHP
jgi:hypothetical protein